MTDKYVTLNTGAKIPAIGLGTWTSEDPATVQSAVEYALLEAGYRHIDTAFMYKNEEQVGAALKKAFDSGIDRKDVFVTTKLWGTFHDRPAKGLEISLEKLGLDYVDLYLMHWPVPLNSQGRDDPFVPFKEDGKTRDIKTDWTYIDTWKEMEKLLDSGKVKAIGVSNLSVPFLEDLLAQAKVVPAVNQVELHPLLPQPELVKFCKDKGIVVEAYSPLGSAGGPLLKNKSILEIAEAHGVSPATILISYHVSSGRVTLPKSVTHKRIADNAKVVELSESDIAVLDKVHETEGIHRFTKPAWGVDLKFPDWKV